MDIVLREEHDQELRERHACLNQELAAKQEELQRWKVAYEDSQRKVASHAETYRRQNAVKCAARVLWSFLCGSSH